MGIVINEGDGVGFECCYFFLVDFYLCIVDIVGCILFICSIDDGLWFVFIFVSEDGVFG